MTSTLPPAEANRVPVHPPYGRGVPEAPLGSPLRGPSRPPTLTEARLRSGLTMTELARALHISRPTLSLWEKGRRRPARSLWPRLAAVLGLELAEVAALFADHPPARLDGRPLPSLSMVRRRSGMTQRELAGLVGVAPTTLAMWENARVRVAPGTADELARVLDTDVAALAAEHGGVAAPDPRPLRRLRTELNMSQREAAAHLGIALGTLAGRRVPTTSRGGPPLLRNPAEPPADRRALASRRRTPGHQSGPPGGRLGQGRVGPGGRQEWAGGGRMGGRSRVAWPRDPTATGERPRAAPGVPGRGRRPGHR
jgi:transcriptional regulator with XRE-family HTH domain